MLKQITKESDARKYNFEKKGGNRKQLDYLD